MAAKKKTAAKKKAALPAKKQSTASKPKPRADFGKPIDAFFAKHAPPLRATLEKLRSIVESTLPKATSSIKWGMPFYELDGKMLCALGGHKAHVNLILSGGPGTFTDPDGLLEGDGKTGRRLVLKSPDEIPVAKVKQWLKESAQKN